MTHKVLYGALFACYFCETGSVRIDNKPTPAREGPHMKIRKHAVSVVAILTLAGTAALPAASLSGLRLPGSANQRRVRSDAGRGQDRTDRPANTARFRTEVIFL